MCLRSRLSRRSASTTSLRYVRRSLPLRTAHSLYPIDTARALPSPRRGRHRSMCRMQMTPWCRPPRCCKPFRASSRRMCASPPHGPQLSTRADRRCGGSARTSAMRCADTGADPIEAVPCPRLQHWCVAIRQMGHGRDALSRATAVAGHSGVVDRMWVCPPGCQGIAHPPS